MNQILDKKQCYAEEVEFKNPLKKDNKLGFIFRFTLVHVITYFAAGLFAFFTFQYSEVFQSTDILSSIMRPTDDPIVRAAVLFQLIRGPILALGLVYFREAFTKRKYGWVRIFLPIYILTGIGAVNAGPGTIEGMIYTTLPILDAIGIGGLIETTLQVFLFSWLLWKWELKVKK